MGRASIGALVATTLVPALVGLCPALHGQTARSVWDGVYTREQADRGEALYVNHCGGCHGPTLAGADAPALAGPEFSANWNTLTLVDLFERIRTSMPPDDPEKLGAQQKTDVLAHMLSVGKFPAGTADLPRDGQVLSQVRYLSMKP
jgi:mono/diheme cytochrome c family protein